MNRREFTKLLAASAALLLTPRSGSAGITPTASFETAEHGILDFYGPELVIKPTVGFNSIRALVNATFPLGGPGGVITFASGQHIVDLPQLADRGSFLIRGQAGSKPQIKARQDNGAKQAAFVINTANKWRPNTYLVMSNLEVTDSRQAMSTANLAGQVCHNCWIHDNFDCGLMWGRPTESGSNHSYLRLGWGEILGRAADGRPLAAHRVMELGHLGSSSTRHNCYLSGQEFIYVSGLFSHSSMHHPFKHVGDRLIVEDSLFYTWWRAGMSDQQIANYLNAVDNTDPYVSVAHIDMVADSQSIIARNVFHHHRLRARQQDERSPGPIFLASRNSSWGCNTPWYGSHEFWEHHADDPARQPSQLFWTRVAAGGYGDVRNSLLFRHYVQQNTFIETGATEGRGSAAICLAGTGPAWPAPGYRDLTGACRAAIDATTRQPGNHNTGSTAPKPPRWRERSYVWSEANSRAGKIDPWIDEASHAEGLGVPHVIESRGLYPHPAF